jgi:hypothetical protein
MQKPEVTEGMKTITNFLFDNIIINIAQRTIELGERIEAEIQFVKYTQNEEYIKLPKILLIGKT